jgi:hypothetical protein
MFKVQDPGIVRSNFPQFVRTLFINEVLYRTELVVTRVFCVKIYTRHVLKRVTALGNRATVYITSFYESLSLP